MEEKLIEAVRVRSVLYNTSDKNYMRTKLKGELWEEIAKEVDIKSGAEAKALWEKLRHSLRDAIRRKQKCFKSGASAQATKEWKFEKQMGFLQPFMTNKSREGNLQGGGDDENQTQNSEGSGTSAEVDKDIVEELNINQQNKGTCLELPEALLSTSATPKAKRFKKDDVASLLKHSLEKRDERAKARTEDRKHMLEDLKLKENDPLFHFFMSMYQSTKRMPLASQHIVKNRVFNAVTDVEATLLNISMYENSNPVYQQRQTCSQSFNNDRATTPPYRSNLTPAATPSCNSNSTPSHSYSDNPLVSTVDVDEQEETTNLFRLTSFINNFTGK